MLIHKMPEYHREDVSDPLVASLNDIINASFLKKPGGHIESLLHMPANEKKTNAHLYSASVP